MACHPRATCHIAGCCHLANSMSWFQSYVSHCSVLPLSKFTVTIPEPHATLQCAVTWRNHCHDRATSQGVRIPSAILKIVFRHILFFLMQLRLWRAAALIVSSPIRRTTRFEIPLLYPSTPRDQCRSGENRMWPCNDLTGSCHVSYLECL